MTQRKQRRTLGDFVEIPLGRGQVSFGWLLEEPLIAFLDYRTKAGAPQDIAELARKPVAFRIWVMNRAVTAGGWTVIGRAPVGPALMERPWFFKQDAVTGSLAVTQTGEDEIPADPERCRDLECAAVWEPEHVVDRLRDHFAGKPNKWLESLRPTPVPTPSRS